ncbi:MAG: nitric oxide reductase large subunit [SAR86 cluster bacterium]|uniref:Nitric oxide reductase large subunit n=1 Tax=SAR86 cluster bacterium TaxID=2030880 RepID=A0A2A5ACY7_9GAMM|nr:MAG: nitric oxide reductase large subunit [SAR86 cluster bacterium]
MSHYKNLFSVKRLWIMLGGSMLVMFSILLYFGNEIYHQAPPIPSSVQTSSGEQIFNLEEIQHGQNVWQSLGGMQRGSIWGHGSYLAPDWSADWLHREAISWLQESAQQRYSQDFEQLDIEPSEVLKTLLRLEIRKNTYSASTGQVIVSDIRARAIANVSRHYAAVFQGGGDAASEVLREQYAFANSVTLSDENMHALNAFFFWTSWSTVTNRPDKEISYTSNWPHEPLVGNTPPASLFMWTIISIMLLLGGIGALVWFYAYQFDHWRDEMEPEGGIAKHNLLADAKITPSMRATAKYFWTVTVLIAAQVLLGIITAHYAIEGQEFYGFPIAEYLPYAITRTWHTQLAILWIVTAWLAAGLYFAPLISGQEPRFQRFGVNFLFTCLLVIVVGSFAGEWLGVRQYIQDMTINFWFGHQGYEYIDLGRFWQIFLFIGLLLWLTLMFRALLPALKNSSNKSLLTLLLIASTAIGLLYGTGLFWGQHTHISIVEYWRWWVVHLWVEGVFEVFATTIVALLFVNMGLLRYTTALTSVLFATIIFLSGGVLGTFHHLYFSGTPLSVLALGGVFSALEVVPLAVIGFEAYHHSRLESKAPWIEYYKWPLMFFSGVIFWNLVGAGLLGFLINPPLALYYMQGLNTTATHGHAALFGVYGMLGIGLMLFCLRGLAPEKNWNDNWLKLAFWSLNIGLAMMVVMSLLPQGLWQTFNSYKYGYWYARSAELVHSPLMENLVWARVPGDTVFAVGVFALCAFTFRLYFPKKLKEPEKA